MPLQEDQKSSTPFKSVDIKTLFLAASNRKRKATSPIPPPTESKSVKVCDHEIDDDIQILDESVISDVSASECKENQDVNTLQSEQAPLLKGAHVVNETDLKSNESDEHMSSENESSKASSDDLNSSLLNSSVNALNTSGLSEANQVTAEKSATANADETKSESKPGYGNEQETRTNPKKRKRMTPEEAKQKAEEREKKQQERLRKKQELEERKLQKEIEKKAREDERKEKERLRLEKKEQEEKEKQLKQEEKEVQKRMRQEMLEAKLEKKKQMEEMKLKQVEERKKAEEEKKKAELEKEQKEREKKEKAKAAFAKFFVKENISPPPVAKSIEQESIFKPFQISEDMTLAPVIPTVARERFNPDLFDAAVISQRDSHLYLQILKSESYQDVRHRKRQKKPKLCETDVIVVESDQVELNLTAKLLQFSENVRPPFWGTWRKKSKAIRPCNPFGQDDIFDYDVDSDDEWDEGGPGESLSGTEQEDESGDDDDNDNYEENEFFVPHGYLSAEEEKDDDETEVDNDPENRKKLLKKKLQEFEMERRMKTTELKPIILGCYIENDHSKPKNSLLLAALEQYSAVFLTDTPVPTSFTVKKLLTESNSNASSPTSANTAVKLKKRVPDEAMPHLIRLAHGNHHSLVFLIKEFQKFWEKHSQPQEQTKKLLSEKPETKEEGTSSTPVLNSPSTDSLISKRQLTVIMRQIATKRPVDPAKKLVWYVNDEVREKHGLGDLSVTNTWTYLTAENTKELDASPVTKPTHSKFSIKEFLA